MRLIWKNILEAFLVCWFLSSPTVVFGFRFRVLLKDTIVVVIREEGGLLFGFFELWNTVDPQLLPTQAQIFGGLGVDWVAVQR